MLPAYRPARYHAKVTERPEVTIFWQGVVRRIQSEGSAYGVMCFYDIVMSMVTGCPTWSRMAWGTQVKCMSYLRTRLLQAEVSQYPEIISQMVSLCACDNLTRRVSTAKAQCNVLRVLFEIRASSGLVDVLTLRVSLEFDRNLSATFLIRTSFDVEGWVPQIIAKVFEKSISNIPHLSELPNQPLDDSINRAGPMLSIISDLRDHYHTVRRISQLRYPPKPLSILRTYLLMRLTYLEGRLINYYIDLTESQEQSEDTWPRAYICLATLFMSHIIVHIPIINGVRLDDRSSNIRKHLRKAILNAERTSDLVCKRRYSNALLWALFVSTSAERLDTTDTNVDKSWFEARFRSQLLRMGLTKWADVHKIILGFPCVPEIFSQDMSWVEAHKNILT